MKKIFFGFFVIWSLAFAGAAYAQIGMMGGNSWGMMNGDWQNGNILIQFAQNEELNDALQNIYQGQNVTSQAEVDCSKVTDDQFEKLGDVYMGVMLPNKQQHQAMDNMMGGEGSASLRQAHMNMGRSYLGCWSNYNSGPIMMPMMGGYGLFADQAGMNSFGPYGNYYTSSGMMNWPSMMGSFYGGAVSFGWFTMILIWVLLILGIVAAVKWLRRK